MTDCGKICYTSKAKAAKTVMRLGRGFRKRNERRTYFCRECQAWHVTSSRIP